MSHGGSGRAGFGRGDRAVGRRGKIVGGKSLAGGTEIMVHSLASECTLFFPPAEIEGTHPSPHAKHTGSHARPATPGVPSC